MAPGEVEAEGPPGILGPGQGVLSDRTAVPHAPGRLVATGVPAFRGGRATLALATLRLARQALPSDARVALELAGRLASQRSAARNGTPLARVVIADADALGRLLWPPTPDALGEAFLRGDIDIEGDIAAAIDTGRAMDLRRLSADELRRLLRWGTRLRRGSGSVARLTRVARMRGRRHSRVRDLAAVRFHYDVGNDFYGLWLDRRLTYSCAYFESTADPAQALDAAQEAKLDLICRKLRLAPGRRLLDIGCGWGSLALFAAERYAVEATGTTLSEPQVSYAEARARREGLGDRARVELRDYRDLANPGSFDAVASVGMFEHVGRANLPVYFAAAFAALRPGGLFLNHGIATAAHARWRPVGLRFRDGGFVGRYVFPDGELVTVEDAIAQARAAGFELLDAQSLRPHYALTLEAWVRRLEASAEQARRLAGDEAYRTWRLCMAAARRGFETGALDVVQLLLARPATRGSAPRPLRPWWAQP